MLQDLPDPFDGPSRPGALKRSGLLDPGTEPLFDRLTAMAARLARAPMAMMSIVAPDRLFFKAAVGLPEPYASKRQASLEHSFCPFVVAARAPYVLEDATKDAGLAARAAVAELGIIAYAGAPLRLADGSMLGTLCVADTQPRLWTPEEIEALEQLAVCISGEIELRAARSELQELRGEERSAGVLSGPGAEPPAEHDLRNGPRTVPAAADLDAVRAETEAALRRSEERYRSLVSATAQIIWSSSASGELSGAQPGWAELTGQAPEELRGWGWLDAVHPEDRERTGTVLRAAVESRTPFELEHRLRRRDGRYREMLVRAVPVLEPDGSVREWIGVHSDLTEQLRARRELEQQAEELLRLTRALERSNRELDQFAYVTSHDLKAPLRGIASLAQWLDEDLAGSLSNESREHLRLLTGRVQRMEGLIEGILQYSRAGRIQSKPERVGVRQLCEETLEMLDAGAEVSICLSEALPTFDAERLPLQQVFLNLLDNALRHGTRPEGGRIEVQSAEEDGWYRFSVKDDGPGIEPQFHERIWGIFQTLQARDKLEGTGIGLALVKKIVETRGGRAWVESRPGAGADFRVLWPKEAIQP
jgi:PAS domain S-box-containing protein